MGCGCGNETEVGSSVCRSPCSVTLANTATCESLPSQIENFTKHFFGSVIKSEVDGQVIWSLPCDLDIGLPANPRNPEEGLACYFLRLFMDGIVGLTGPQGVPGNDGADGLNAYTVTIAGFTQPSLLSPTIQVSTVYNPAIYQDMVVNIQTSGWYHVDLVDGSGNLWLTLITPATGAVAGTYVIAGKLVVLTGPQGASITGPQGAQGPVGPTGPMGGTYSTTNGQVVGDGISFDVQPANYTQVLFGVVEPTLLLPVAGTYLLTAQVTISKSGTAPSNPPDAVYLELWDANASQAIIESRIVSQNLGPNEWGTMNISVLYTVNGANHSIQLYAKTSGIAGDTFVEPMGTGYATVMSYVRLA